MEIPVLLDIRTVGTQKGRKSQEWKNWYKRGVKPQRKNLEVMIMRDVERTISSEVSEPMLPRKAAIVYLVPVP